MPDTALIWKPTDCYSMTEGRGLGGRPQRKPKVTAGLRAAPLPAWMLDRISGNEVIQLRVTTALDPSHD